MSPVNYLNTFQTLNWEQRIGRQRDWRWRGWQIRYSFLRSQTDKGRPIVLLHGFGAAIEHWRHNMPVLSEKYPVYGLDLLGFGGSQKAPADYSVFRWAEQVRDFCAAICDQPVILVGNSLGSLVAMTVAGLYPEQVKALAMISLPDVAMREEQIPAWLWPLVQWSEQLIASPLLLRTLFPFLRQRAVLKLWTQIAYVRSQAVTPELIEILARPPQDEGAARTFVQLCRSVGGKSFAPAARDILPQLSLPILLIWGEQDRMVPPQIAPRFLRFNPQIEYHLIPSAGHCVHDECPDLFNQLLLDWLEQTG
ncbi:MAG: alpha/beta fold hydrolase [Cyanobacteria bacterium P01_H01_bin.15]